LIIDSIDECKAIVVAAAAVAVIIKIKTDLPNIWKGGTASF
jgi:hypothetical protein